MDSGSISITNQRHFEVDAEKAFVIVVMGVIHVYEILSNIDFHTLPTGFFRIILEFLAGPFPETRHLPTGRNPACITTAMQIRQF